MGLKAIKDAWSVLTGAAMAIPYSKVVSIEVVQSLHEAHSRIDLVGTLGHELVRGVTSEGKRTR
jgi:hypothetical protein